MSHVSIIIPAYNEAAALREGRLGLVAAWRAAQPFGSELIVVDDGSRDETAELARPVADRVLRIEHAGKAAAIMAGIQAARGAIVLFADMDLATPISEAAKLLSVIPASTDIAIGSRGLLRSGAPAGRYLLSWGHVAMRRMLLGLPIADTQCGFKAATRESAMHILDHLHIYHPTQVAALQKPSVTSGFDVEFLYVARCLGYRVQEVPVLWNYRQARHVSLVNDAWRGAMDLGHMLIAHWKGEYPLPHPADEALLARGRLNQGC